MSSQQSGSKSILEQKDLVDLTVGLFYGSYENDRPKLIGTEVEMPVVDIDTLKPIPFSGPKSITSIFNALCQSGTGWKASSIENGKITSLKNDTGEITLEPGGQIEFAGKAEKSLHDVAKNFRAYYETLEQVSEKIGVDVVPYGFHPHVSIDDVPYISERSRFKALKPVFEAEKGYAAWGQSSSVQITLDAPSKEDAFDAFRVGLLLQPISAAMFANSAFSMGQESGFKSWRRQNLLALDSPLYRVPKNLFDKDYTLRDWADHVLNVPMSFIVRDEAYIAVAPKPFRDVVGTALPELAHLPEDQQYLTQNDLLDHLTGIKPEMYLKPGLLLEFRAADLSPNADGAIALSAFWTGLFYDSQSFEKIKEYVSTWTAEDRENLRVNVARDGLQTVAAGKTARDIALDLIDIAKEGLSRIEPGAVSMLDPIVNDIAKGITPADKTLQLFRENKGDIVRTVKDTLMFAANKKSSPQAKKPSPSAE